MKREIALLTLILFAGLLIADMGGPDGFGYFWADEEEASVTFDWTPPDFVSAGEIVFPTPDDDAVAIPLPFPVTFYDTTYEDSIIVTTNGVACFNATEAEAYSNQPIPDPENPNAAIYAYWDDMRSYDSSAVFYQTDGTAPDRVFTINWWHWYMLGYSSDTLDPLYFQIQIYESDGSEPNVIKLQYLDPSMSSLSRTNGTGATIGIEDAEGLNALQYSYNETSLDSGRAIKIWRPEASTHDCGVVELLSPTGDGIVDAAIDVTVLLRNYGADDEPVVPTFLDIVSEMGDTIYSVSETTAIDSGAYDTLTFTGWIPDEGGVYTINCEVDVDGDTVGFNDAVIESLMIWEHISRGGPDGAGYMWYDSYDESGPSYVAPPIAEATPTEISGDDDLGVVDLPFTFTYYDVDYDAIAISTNGWISFDTSLTSSDYINDSIPDPLTPNAMLAPYWDDQDCDVFADSTAAIMTYNDIGTSSFWVIWNNVQLPYSADSSDITYGVRLRMDGSIEYHYLDARSDYHPDHTYGASATVGIENLDGSDGLLYEYDGWPPGNPLFDHFAIRFVPPWAGPDTTGPNIAHFPPDSIFAIVPGFCINVEAEIRDFNVVEDAAIHVHYPTVEVREADTVVGDMYTFTICDLQPGDSVSYHFEASDTLSNTSASDDYNIYVNNPHQGGPDIMGYHFADSWADWDSMAPEHDWMELNPDSGGLGTEVIFGFSGLSEPIAMSEVIPFYGITTEALIISEDGWALLDTGQAGAPIANPPSPFPNDAAPNGIIAPLWIDLEAEYSGLTGGAVYYHDYTTGTTGENCFIIQWDMYETATSSPDLLRFQAKIYYDEEIYGSRIEFVYRNIEDYARDEAGICIEHETGYDGLAYLYLGEPAGAPIPVSESSVLFFNPELHGVGETKLPEEFAMTTYPNPFNASVAIDVTGVDSNARLEIFDINGRMVKDYSVEQSRKIIWEGNDSNGEPLSSGIYFARLISGDKEIRTRLVLLK